MVYHECYGELPPFLWAAIRKFHVSPSDFYLLEAQGFTYEQMHSVILNNSSNGLYRPPIFRP